MAHLATLGITAVHTFEGLEDLSIYRELEREGRLPLRLLVHLAAGELDDALALGLPSGFGSDRLRLGGVKFFLDGAIGSRTAHLLEPYLDGNENRGVETLPRDRFEAQVVRAQNGGIVPVVHAIGDAATRIALDVFEAHPPPFPLPFPRRIEHAQLVHPDDRPRFARAGVVASMQPSHLFVDIEILQRCLGDRCDRAFPLASLLRAGAVIAFGSDAPIEDPDPRRGLYAAVARARPDGHPEGGWHPDESIGIGDAVDAYTLGGAIAGGVDHRQGRIRPGADADLVVLEGDPFAARPEELLEMRVRRTLVAGQDICG
jgi:predicted amidohydrolase YtcJ